MASKQGSLGFVLCVSLLTFSCVSFSSSSESEDDWLEYSLAEGTRKLNTNSAIHVEGLHSERSKRQAEEAVPASPSTPGSSSSGGDTSSSAAPASASPAAPASASPAAPASVTNVPTTLQHSASTGSNHEQTDSGSNQVTTTPAPTAPPSPTTTPQQATDVGVTTESPNATIVPTTIKDTHNYYKSSIIPDAVDDHFVIMTNPQTHGSLNSAHRLAGMIDLPFKFRFYGHTITNITVATGGFIYMSPFLHRYLARTQYVAPLMANFHTAASNESNIFFQLVGDEFVIEWQKVLLKNEEEKGPFIFQAKLKKDGTITFVYKNLPVPLSNVSTEYHPVKIGLSDAYYNDTYYPQQGIIRRQIIVYHSVAFSVEQIEQGTVLILTPLPTCNTIEDCKTCALHTGVKFNCKWCSNVGRCSDGNDWFRQNWAKNGCETTDGSCKKRGKKNTAVAAAVTVSVMLAILLVAVGAWAYYAYTHPTSPSGIWLMEHRPSVLRTKLANVSCCKKKPPPSSRYAMESTA